MKQPNQWTCLPTALSILLDRKLSDVLSQIGHDGSELLWPDMPDPLCRRGFHPTEIVKCCLEWNVPCYLMSPISYRSCPDVHAVEREMVFDYTRYPQIIGGRTRFGNSHAIAYKPDVGYIDPANGLTYTQYDIKRQLTFLIL